MKRIFTFWEPKENIPAYIKLCMQTWYKFLPDYEIVVLDYENLRDWIRPETYNAIVFKRMSLAKQSDALRAALLNEHGGIWLDADTIITGNDFITRNPNADVIMIGRPKTDGVIYGAFIYAAHAHTAFISEWYNALPRRIAKYRFMYKHKIIRKFMKSAWRAAENWDYCVNAIIDKLGKKYTVPDFYCIDRDDIGALPEYQSPLNVDNIDKAELYKRFYFEPENAKSVLKNTHGIILLHNSWTPANYRNMTEKQFMSQNILLTNILKELLK